MTALQVRGMHWWDIPRVVAIEERVFPTTAWSSAQFWSELARDDRAYLVAESEGEVVAYAGVMARRPTADIQTLAVDPDWRGRGLARDLLKRLLTFAADRGCTEILLEVRADNAEATALYATEDFEVIARRAGYYGPGEDALIMRRRSR